MERCDFRHSTALSRFVRSERLAYITRMSNEDVVDNLNLKIHITESLPNFAEFTVVEAATPLQQLRTIYIEHLDEFSSICLSIETWYSGSSC